MRYAEKFSSRCEAKIHLVWEEWFWDSLDFGGRFGNMMCGHTHTFCGLHSNPRLDINF
jgi:hypothetical protein